MVGKPQLIVIDDDTANQLICSIIVKMVGNVELIEFTDPVKSIDYMENDFPNQENEAIVFLDLKMPEMNGWQWLEKYDTFSDKVKKKIKLYVVSSSVKTVDKIKALNNRNVVDYITKPMSYPIMKSIFDKFQLSSAV